MKFRSNVSQVFTLSKRTLPYPMIKKINKHLQQKKSKMALRLVMVHDTQNTPYNSIHQTVEGDKP